ncbi:DUF411 domain-containing protein [Kangiella spongicola]|uniref:Metal-binding protein n=1 Tax=Kangiella spongicola TaxID=796379 RepID=A0A318D9U6_9GAMM|nr:DUF411 domain-containing protein [Kangiella spongicola]PXF62939.1 hypothetical protein DL796_05665 [Kangiella spongicola]
MFTLKNLTTPSIALVIILGLVFPSIAESAAKNVTGISDSTSKSTSNKVAETQSKDSALEQLHAIIYKNEGCTCCDKWASHLNKEQFETELKPVENINQIKQELGVNSQLSSCHTAVIKHNSQQYVFEGHIPAKIIKQFLANPPKHAIGLAVPAMPVGSPGMEYQGKFMPYKVFLLHDNGQISIFASVDSLEEQYLTSPAESQ